MLKGKFYTGLPEKMMNRTVQPVDRQRTQFYWPDESDVEERPARSVRRTASMATSRATSSTIASALKNNNAVVKEIETTVEIKPKELFQKQLASGIEFYDNVNAKTPESRRRRFKKIDNVNLTNNNNDVLFVPEQKKLETFSSKIEFYDYADDVKLNNSKNNSKNIGNDSDLKKKIDDGSVAKSNNQKSSTKKNDGDGDLKKKLPERTDSMKKRISFKPADVLTPPAATKGILKKPGEKKAGLAKKSLSKSVENIPRMVHDSDDDDDGDNKKAVERKNDLASVVRDVKNLNLEETKPKRGPTLRSRYADFDEEDTPYSRGSKSNNSSSGGEKPQGKKDDLEKTVVSKDSGSKDKNTRRSYDDYKDDYRRRDDDHDEGYPHFEPHSKINRKYSEDFYERRTNYRSGGERNKRFDDDVREYRRYESPTSRVRYSPVRRDSPDGYYHEEWTTERRQRTPPSRYGSRDRYDDDYSYQPPRTSRSNREDHYSTTSYGGGSGRAESPASRYDRRSPRRQYSPERRRPSHNDVSGSGGGGYSSNSAHRHLRSTFSFDQQVPQQNRPVSVRQSAVQRVGVGLPDFQ